jgi:glycosyltransferase involved in cell wall biosynthesis
MLLVGINPMTKFTVMIPTRERCETLVHTLASCVAQPEDNFEIIVSDNCSEDDTEQVVMSFNDRRIKYIKTARRLSMTGNFEFALTHATGDYVMYLGDDDGLAPDALSRVSEIVQETRLDAVISSQAQYHWPNALDELSRNRLVFSAKPGYEIRPASDVLRRVLDFKLSYTELPGAYAGFVSRRVLCAAMDKGVYFHSITPDAYSGIVNAAILDSYVYVHTPFCLAGLSGRSNGASQLGRVGSQDAGSRESVRYENENDLPYHPSLVYCPSYEIIMAEAFFQAKDHVPGVTEFHLDVHLLCDIALCEAPTWNYKKIEAAVKVIRSKHKIPHTDYGEKPRSMVRRATFRRLTRGVRRLRLNYKILNCRDFGVVNVHQAGQLMNTISAYIRNGYASRTRSLQFWLARLWSRS